MAWNMTGNMIEFCSCKAMCPCFLGPVTQPDQGWCASAIAYEIEKGKIDGIDVGGCIRHGEKLSVSVGEFGNATIELFKDQAGKHASVQGTAAQAAFQSASMDLGSSRGTRWTDPDLRKWEGDSATFHKVNWSG
jgi:hypothetical protein